MAHYASKVELVNAALARSGIRAIQDIDDQSKQARLVADAYEGIVEDELTKHAWTFATKDEALVYQGTHDGEYSSVFALPSEQISIKAVSTAGGTLIKYAVVGGKVLTSDAAPLRIRYVWRAPEYLWASDFADGIVMRWQATCERALKENYSYAETLDQKAEQKLLRAMVRDRRQQSDQKRRVIDGGYVAAWRGGY